MAVGFAGTTFAVDLAGAAELPDVVRRDGVRVWEATVLVRSATARDALVAKLSDVTVKPALGTVDSGVIVVEAGYGMGNLTIPTPAGEETWRAALVAAEPIGVVGGTVWRIAVSFVVGDKVSG